VVNLERIDEALKELLKARKQIYEAIEELKVLDNVIISAEHTVKALKSLESEVNAYVTTSGPSTGGG